MAAAWYLADGMGEVLAAKPGFCTMTLCSAAGFPRERVRNPFGGRTFGFRSGGWILTQQTAWRRY